MLATVDLLCVGLAVRLLFYYEAFVQLWLHALCLPVGVF